ncbi:MAG: MFS transporter [Chloroflexi bacterium]|nr:MFS transporter [Chloroflexota bacterium]
MNANHAAPLNLRTIDFVTMNLYYLGLSVMWQSIGRFLLQSLTPLPHIAGRDNAEAALGAITFTGLLIATIVQPIAGSISDNFSSRFGRRRPFMFVFTLTDLVFLAGIAFAPNLAWLFIAYCLLQFSSNLAHGPYQGLLADLVPEEKRGIASGIRQFIDTSGIIVVALLVPILISGARDVASGVSLSLAVVASVLVATMLLNFALVREPARITATPARSARAFALRDWLRAAPRFAREYPDFVWLIATRLFTLGALALVSNYAQFYFQKVLFAHVADLDAQIKAAVKMQGDLLTVVVLALILFTLAGGPLSDRWGRRPLVAFGSLLAGAGAFGLMFVRNVPLIQLPFLTISDLVACGMLIGIGIGLFLSPNWAWAIDLMPREKGGQFLGLTNLATAGATVVTSLLGFVIGAMNLQQPGSGFTMMFLVATIGFVLGAVLVVKIRETSGARG